ncbi:MAG TPA: lytic transglycosylase domain-containing protein [Candidatus Polarisedimenticolaceae bacterium]|nr:lytic transglycosylase domain-containing protein [Candidatus Polarisedimenticolaceae bacterium]
MGERSRDGGRRPADRRDLLRLGLAGGVLALVGRTPVRADPPAGYAASDVHRAHPLEFRLDSDYGPDLSDRAARLLVGATLDFLRAEHPDGLTLSFWELNPAEMPYLPRHIESIVEHVFRGVKDQLALRPVDPLVVLALLYNESRFHPKVVSPSGAVGMAQFMPDTALEYGLAPIAHLDLWRRSRESRAAYLADRQRRIDAFLERHALERFDAERAIDGAIASGGVELLGEYRALTEMPDPSQAALGEYVAAIEQTLAQHEFFWDGREPLERLDGRVGYQAVTRAVRYIALRIAEHQGMSSTAVAAYNSGPEPVRVANPESILHRFGDIPPYPETVRYVQRFMAVYSAIKYRLFRNAAGETA